MKLEPSIIIAMVQRKGVTLAAGMALGAVLCAEYPQLYALVKQAVAVVGVAGAVGAIASVLMSVKNEKEGIADVQKALLTPVPCDQQEPRK
jgi:uncharacterized membrane protein YccC